MENIQFAGGLSSVNITSMADTQDDDLRLMIIDRYYNAVIDHAIPPQSLVLVMAERLSSRPRIIYPQ